MESQLDSTNQYIDGATNPNYVLTANDVEYIPINDQGRRGETFTALSANGPGIEGFRIIGSANAKPGNELLACGYMVNGTSLCMFQWIRYYPDGTKQYIDEATDPTYVLTADDVDKVIAVECVPMDDQGREGDLVTALFSKHYLPGIEGLRIVGSANVKPGNELVACGYIINGTSLCMFQWIRYYSDGTKQYIDGATDDTYVLTADDVDKVIAVECIPVDDQGRKGDLITASFSRDGDVPGIEGLRIIGAANAKPGKGLLACGYSVNGTSLCTFQWVRFYPDGTREYIPGANGPNYVITADDVDKVIAVECLPFNDQGHQGDVFRVVTDYAVLPRTLYGCGISHIVKNLILRP